MASTVGTTDAKDPISVPTGRVFDQSAPISALEEMKVHVVTLVSARPISSVIYIENKSRGAEVV